MYKISNHLFFDEPRKLFKFVFDKEVTLEHVMCLMYSYKDIIGDNEVYLREVNVTSLFRKICSDTEMYVGNERIVWVYPVNDHTYLVLHCYYISYTDVYQYVYAEEFITKEELKELGYEKCSKS